RTAQPARRDERPAAAGDVAVRSSDAAGAGSNAFSEAEFNESNRVYVTSRGLASNYKFARTDSRNGSKSKGYRSTPASDGLGVELGSSPGTRQEARRG